MLDLLANFGRTFAVFFIVANVLIAIFVVWLVASGVNVNEPPFNVFLLFPIPVQQFAEISQQVSTTSDVFVQGIQVSFGFLQYIALIGNIIGSIIFGGALALSKLAFMYDPLLGVMVTIIVVFLQFCAWLNVIYCMILKRC